LKAIIIPGAEATAIDFAKVSWKNTLVTFIQNLTQNHKHIKLLGIQFGSQIISQALGGSVEKLPIKMQIGKEVIELAPAFF
jgi:GMP synthase-like glutamine amidotransferase